MFKEIKKLHKQGNECIAGVDEAGRGPLAGPVLACAVVLFFSSLRGAKSDLATKQSRGDATRSPRSLRSLAMTFGKIRDSKKLSAKQREEWYKILTEYLDIEWAVASVPHKMIDKINILEATKLAMRRAVKNLQKSVNEPIDCLIIDGSFSIRTAQSPSADRRTRGIRFLRSKTSPKANIRPSEYKQIAIPKADEKIFVCMAAGIIAKVTRDRIMKRLHKKYPEYGFDKHKGYGTRKHIEAIRKFGVCKIHRKSFKPIKSSSPKTQYPKPK